MEFGNFGICIVNTCFSHFVGLNLNLFHCKLLLSAPTTFNWQPSLVSKHNIKTKSDENSRGVACNVFNYDAMQLNKRWKRYRKLLNFIKIFKTERAAIFFFVCFVIFAKWELPMAVSTGELGTYCGGDVHRRASNSIWQRRSKTMQYNRRIFIFKSYTQSKRAC